MIRIVRNITLLFVCLMLACCGGRSGSTTTAEADSLVNEAYDRRDYDRLILLADSLRLKGVLADGEAYFWLGYAYDRQMQKRMAEFYWNTGIETVGNLEDPLSLHIYANIASRLTGLKCTIGDYETALRIAETATEWLQKHGCDTTGNYTNLLIYIGCCQSRFGLESETNLESLERAYQMHLGYVERQQTAEAYKDAIVGVVNVSYNFIEIHNYEQALAWTERYDELIERYDATGKARPDYIDKQRARCLIFKATALEGLGREIKAAKVYSAYQQTQFGQSVEGKIIACDYLGLANRWDEAADNYSNMAALQEQYTGDYTLENIQKTYLKKFNVNMMAGRMDSAVAVSLDITQHLDSSITSGRTEDARELEKLHQTATEMTARHEQMTRQRQLSRLFFMGLLIVALVIYSILRQRVQLRLQKAHDDLQQAYHHLEVANARAEESSRMKSNFIQQISHEIRTPLNILSGFTQIVTTPGMELEDGERQEINKGIVENTGRITDLVNKMLELSDAKSHTVIKRTDEIPAIQIAVEATDASGISHAKHLDYDMQISPEAEMILLTTNRRAATRALSLLLDNACKFTKMADQQANASHEAEVSDKKAVLRLQVADGMLQFIVEDTGIGIPPSEAERIFEEFVQLDEYYEGTGIGLTVARSLVQRIGGDIVLDTTYTDGARFVMTLPTTHEA